MRDWKIISNPKPLVILFITYLAVKPKNTLNVCKQYDATAVRNKLKSKVNSLFMNENFFRSIKYLECVWFKIFDIKIEHYRFTKVRSRPRLVWPIFMSQFTRVFSKVKNLYLNQNIRISSLIITGICMVLLLLCIFRVKRTVSHLWLYISKNLSRTVFTWSWNVMWRILLSFWRGTKVHEISVTIPSLFFTVSSK